MIIDIFGNPWIVIKRVDSGYGFDLLYGASPDEADKNANRIHGLPHIIDGNLENFILNNLKKFPSLPLPITLWRRQNLRRMISSRRYKSIADWEKNRSPSEEIFWVHRDHIPLPEIKDINGHICELTAIKYFQPGKHIWVGYPITKKHKNQASRYILTPEIAHTLFETAHLKKPEHALLNLPMCIEMQRRLRHKAVAHFRPDLHSMKTAEETYRRRDMHMSPAHTKGAEITDTFGQRWHVHQIRETPQGDIIMRGSPLSKPRSPGVAFIITHEIAALFDADTDMGSHRRLGKRLGQNQTMISLIRQKLGARSPVQASDIWWEERIDDLLSMRPIDFSRHHQSSYKTAISMKQAANDILKYARNEGHGLAHLKDLAENIPAKNIADALGYKTTRNINLRQKALRILKNSNKIQINQIIK